jgi:hypothetical protein
VISNAKRFPGPEEIAAIVAVLRSGRVVPGPVAEQASPEVLSLPLHPDPTGAELNPMVSEVARRANLARSRSRRALSPTTR